MNSEYQNSKTNLLYSKTIDVLHERYKKNEFLRSMLFIRIRTTKYSQHDGYLAH